MLTFLVVIISLSLIVFFHEFGHFIFSKLAKIKIEEFGFGYPPRAVGLVKIKNTNKWKIFFGKKVPREELASTIYSVNFIPFGGFNKIKGEEGEVADTEKDSFYAKPWWQRFFSVSGGVIMNIILAMILFSLGFSVGIPSVAKESDLAPHVRLKPIGIQIIAVQKNSPAEKAGIILGDVVLKVGDQEIKEEVEMQNYIDKKANQEVTLKIKRRGKEMEIKVTPKPAAEVLNKEELKNRTLKGGVIGVTLMKVNIISYPFYLAIIKGVETTFVSFWKIIEGTYLVLKELIVRQKMIGEMMGVVGIGAYIGEIYQIGFVYLIQMVAIISLAIAVFQLIPFPALDGGRLLFIFIETIRKKPVSRKVEALIHNIGFSILLLLMVFVTYRDLMRLGERLFR